MLQLKHSLNKSIKTNSLGNFNNLVLSNSSINKNNYSTAKTLINLSYDLNDKYKSDQALVIAHGLFASKLSWRALARRINEQTKQKVYTVDLRNHGDSLPYVDAMSYIEMSEDLKFFIENVVKQKDQVKFVTLMGHSMGGKTAMSLALTNPDCIDKLIVADISPNISPSTQSIGSFLQTMKKIDMNSLNPNLFKARKEVDENLCTLKALKDDPNQRQFLLTRLVERNGKIIWHFNLNSIINHLDDIMGFPEFQSKFSKQTLFIGGELSNYITEKDIPSIEKYFKNFKISKVAKAGHVIHFDNPTETIRQIDNFLLN